MRRPVRRRLRPGWAYRGCRWPSRGRDADLADDTDRLAQRVLGERSNVKASIVIAPEVMSPEAEHGDVVVGYRHRMARRCSSDRGRCRCPFPGACRRLMRSSRPHRARRVRAPDRDTEHDILESDRCAMLVQQLGIVGVLDGVGCVEDPNTRSKTRRPSDVARAFESGRTAGCRSPVPRPARPVCGRDAAVDDLMATLTNRGRYRWHRPG